MKKRVRIYQMGGAQAMQNVGNVNSGPSDDELINAAMSMIGEQNASPDEVLTAFVKNGIQPDKANQVIGLVVQHINNETELGNAQVADSDNRAALEEEEMLKQEEANRIAEEENARRNKMYQEMYADQGSADYSDDDQVAMDMLMKYGGMLNKKSFVKNVMSLAKKQMGGDSNTDNNVDDKSFGRKESGLDAFVKAAQNSANNALMKKDAENMYSNLQSYFQDGGDVESGVMNFDPYHNLAHYSDAFEHAMPNLETDIVQAQYGGMRPGQVRRMQRRVNRMIGQVPAAMYNSRQTMFPQGINIMTMPMMGPQSYAMPARGMYQGGPQLANIDVRKVGLFGKPKEYTITFAQEAYYNPQLRQNVIRQEEVNEETTVTETIEEQKAAETNTATTENKEVLAETAKTSNGTTGTIPVKKTDVKKVDTPKKTSYETSLIRDPWDRLIGDKWYGFDPDKKAFVSTDGTVKKPFVIPKNNPYLSSSERLMTLPQAAAADDEFWQTIVLGGAGILKDLGKKGVGQFTFKDMPKGYLPGQRGLPSPKGGFSAPNAWGAGPRGLGPGQNVLNPGQGMLNPGQGMLNPGQRFLGPGMGFQQGGFTDQDSGLYKFINGGNELGIPQINGKITDDPYFKNGGLIKAQKGVSYRDPYSGWDGTGSMPWFTASNAPQAWKDAHPKYKSYFESDGNEDKKTVGQTDNTPVEVLDNQGNVVRQTTLADAEKNNLKHRVITSNTQNTNSNKKKYDALKELGVNVGEYRDGIKYEDLHKFPKMVNSDSSQKENYPKMVNSGYYNPQIGAMYPPLFGGRRGFRPPGRAIEYAGSWLQQQGLPIDPRTGQVIGQMPTNLPLTKIDVTKSSMFGRRPKEFTMYYGNQGTGQAPTTASKRSGSKASDSNESQDQLRQYSGVQNVLAQIPGLSKFVNDPKGDYVSAEGMVSPEDYQQPKLPLKKALLPTIADEAREPIARDFSTSNNTSTLSPELLPTQDYTDEELKELGMNEIVDIQPEVFNTANQENTDMFMQTRPAQTLNPYVNNFEPSPLEINQAILNQYTQDVPLSDGISGPQSEDNALFEQYRNQDLMGSGMSLLGMPNASDEYNNILANQNSLARQNFDLNQMYEQDPNYYNRAPYNTPLDFDSFDYTQQVGPTAPIINVPSKSSSQKRKNKRQKETVKNNTKKEIKEQIKKETTPAPVKNNAPTGPGGPRTNKYEVQAQQERMDLMTADRKLYNLYLREYRDSDKTMSEFKKDNPAVYNRMFGKGTYQYGGHLPQAQTGIFTTNPNMVGYSDIDLLNSQTAPEVTGAESAMGNWWEPMPGSNMPTIQDTGVEQPEEIFTDPNQPNRATEKRQYDPRGAAVKYKAKNMYNVDFERGVNQVNRGINQGLAMLGERGDRQRMADMQNNLTADNLYGSTGIQNRGTYETNSGLFRPDEMGFTGIVRNGGYMQDGGDVYGEDDETWMSEEQIRQFLAEGGELEFI